MSDPDAAGLPSTAASLSNERSGRVGPNALEWLAWQIPGFLLVGLWVSQTWFGGSPWEVPQAERVQVIGQAACYLVAVLLVAAVWRNAESRLRSRTLMIPAVCLGATYGLLAVTSRVQLAAVPLLVASVIVIAFPHLPWLVARFTPGVRAALLVMVTALTGAGLVLGREAPEGTATRVRTLRTTLGSIDVTWHEGLIPEPTANGGGIEVDGDGYLVVTRNGRFFRLTPDGESIRTEELPFTVPINRHEFHADVPPEVNRVRFRVTDLLIDRAAEPTRYLVTHHFWKADRGCVVMRLTALDVEADSPGTARASTLFETSPCLPVPRELVDPFGGHVSGGRLARLDGEHVLMTVGNHAYNYFSQDPAADYGKTLRVNTTTGVAEIFTLGHRNQQGLLAAFDRTIWSTEHGPEGGDELNILRAGANYGWPYRTHGVEYEDTTWPLAGGDSLVLEPPVFSWVPSIGVSNLVEVRQSAFPGWAGDLLVGSLVGNSLFRLRLDAGSLEYAEQIEIGARVRDLAEGADGTIVIWADGGAIITVRPARRLAGGAEAFQACAECHPVRDGRTHGIGPDLFGVYGRRIASAPGFDYSEAMDGWAGSWTARRLTALVEDPALAAPGTSMTFEGIADSTRRAALVEYLKTLR